MARTLGVRSRSNRTQSGTLRLKEQAHPTWVIAHLILFAYFLSVVGPMLWTLLNSFKTSPEIFSSPWSLPADWNFDNYITAWTKMNAGTYLLNSVVVSVLTLALVMSIGSMAAYVLARYQFRGNRVLYFAFIAGLMIPGFLMYIPAWFLHDALGLLDTTQGLIIQYTAFSLSFTIFFLYGFFKTLPKELEEQGLVDGLTPFGVFFRIMLPLSKSGLLTVTVFNFLSVWNEFTWALISIYSESKKTIPLGTVNIIQQARFETDWGAMFAGFMLIALPTLVVYAIFQSRLTEGITVGAVKG